jgi:hypothetical protein
MSDGDPTKAPEENGDNEMNRIFATALLTAASLVPPMAAFAQNLQQATIPFDFTVGKSSLPAGRYSVTPVSPNMIVIRGWKGQELVSAMTMTTPIEEVRKNANNLIFHKYGDRYFLSEIRGSLGNIACRVGASPVERNLQRQLASVTRQDNTVIALK